MNTIILNIREGEGLATDLQSFPFCSHIALPGACAVKELLVPGQQESPFLPRVYGSADGVSFARLSSASFSWKPDGLHISLDEDKPLRFLRLLFAGDMQPFAAVRLQVIPAEDPGAAPAPLPDPVAALPAWEESPYSASITDEMVEQYLGDMVGRLVDEPYISWFSFHVNREARNGGRDWFRVYAEDGRIAISGPNGVSLSCGLNYALKYLCLVHIAEQEKQVHMPDAIPLPAEPIEKHAYDDIRYANNYCTLSYTMPFWQEAEWQRELDWLALNGVNLILDFTGIEAVWVLFLRELGASEQEIRQWLVSPCHTAWQQMQNIEGFGGPLDLRFVAERVMLARKMQYAMRLLGMQPVRQGYAGMLPLFLKDTLPGIAFFPQGRWNGLPRPAMVDVSADAYRHLAARFYHWQSHVLGNFSHYYAADPYHEGGKRPEGLSDAAVAACVLDGMLAADPRATWLVQAWLKNPSAEFLQGFAGENREHLLILDLSSTDHPGFPADEYQGSPWLYCMLDMYGGRYSTHGDADALAADIPAARRQYRHMRGIGHTAEATWQNPVVFELLYDMAWHERPVDLLAWIRDYCTRRYGLRLPELEDAWDILLATAYKSPGHPHHGGYTQIFCYRPRLSMQYGEVYNELNSSVLKRPYYEPRAFFEAVRRFCAVYEQAKEVPCYVYDLQDLLRQSLNLLGTEAALRSLRAYEERDLPAFRTERDAFLSLLTACDRLMYAREDTTLSSWVGKAARSGARFDDFSRDLFCLDARALITTWGYRDTYLKLADYAYRQYGGLLGSYYKERWELWFARLEEALLAGSRAGEISPEEWFVHDWGFVLREEDAAGYTADGTEKPPASTDLLLRQAMQEVESQAKRLWNHSIFS